MSTNQVREIQSKYLAGEQLSADDAAILLQRLQDSASERQEMLINEAIDNQLRCMARLNDEELVERFVSETVQRALAVENGDDHLGDIRVRERKSSRSFQSYLFPMCVCTISMAFIGIAISLYLSSPHDDDFDFAHFTNSTDLSWELLDSDSRRLRFSSGYTEVHFENGTIAQVTAPAVIELTAPRKLFVENGSIAINVPPAAVGFTVETPVARIVDFGTEFDVAVGEKGATETRVRSGMVTFEAHSTSPLQGEPIKLTAEGLNRASAAVAELTSEISSISTTASGSRGQFFGTIHADGETVEFDSRQEFDDFLDRLNLSVRDNPSDFHEQWKVMVRTTPNSTSTTVESSSGSGPLDRFPENKAQDMLLEQLRSMQQRHQDNPQMQELIEEMIRQSEGSQDEKPE